MPVLKMQCKVCCILGYNDFDYYFQNGATQTGNRCQMGFLKHIYKIQFSFFLVHFCPILALKLAQSANISKTIFLKIRNGYHILKCKIWGTEFKSVEKSAKKLLQKVLGRKLSAQ